MEQKTYMVRIPNGTLLAHRAANKRSDERPLTSERQNS